MAESIPGSLFGAPYAVGGFVDPHDEMAQQLALVNPWLSDQKNLYGVLELGLDQGDEVFEPNTFAYIPTEQQIAAALAVANMQAMLQASAPVQERTPALRQLTSSLYQQAAALWQELSVADTEGW